MASNDLLRREEVLGGMPARRAQSLLFLIETRTAALVAQSRQAVERFLTEQAGKERDLAFLEAFALGREPRLRPTIQDLEQHATRWADLVPDNTRLRAAIAHLVGQKYELPKQRVPGMRAALGLDTEAVRGAYERQFGTPLDSVYTPRVTPLNRVRWAWAALAGRLESLPPFWISFALTLTETVGAGILALPIALAAVGPLGGIVLLAVLGVVNQLTIAAVAESVARSGAVRYGNAFFGRMVAEYLGAAGSVILSVSLAVICLVGLLAYYIGAGTILADATRVPAAVWAGLIFLVGVYFLSRQSLSSTVASALAVGAVNLAVIVAISLLTLTHLKWANLSYLNLPLVGGRPFDPSILRLIFGVVLLAYFGHMSVGSCARVVLQRDPSARSLIRGSIAAQVAAMLLYCLWVLAVNGAIAPQTLAGLSGTALAPLVVEVGPSVQILGSLFAILAMGMASIHLSLGLMNMTRERLPARSRTVLLLPRRQGRLVFAPRRGADDGLRLEVTYLGLEGGQPRLRLDADTAIETRHVEFAAGRRWELSEVMDRLPELKDRRLSLSLDVLDPTRESLRVGVTSSMSMSYEGGWDSFGLRMVDALLLPDDEQQLVSWLLRRGEAALADVTAYTGQDQRLVRARLTNLVKAGYIGEVEVAGEVRYRARLGRRRGRTLPEYIWRALQDGDSSAPVPPRSRLMRWIDDQVLGERGRFMLSMTPTVVVFLLCEWLLVTGTQSFAAPLSFGGLISATLVGGLFPVLMLVAARRKAELVPGLVFGFLGHPIVAGAIYLLFLTNLFLHGLVIWSGIIERASAVAVGVLAVGATIGMLRRGAFTPRAVIELRDDQRDGQAAFAVTVQGQPAVANVRLRYADREQACQAAVGGVPMLSALRQAIFEIPVGRARELKVWAHQITREGQSQRLPALVEVTSGGESTRQFDLRDAGEQVLLPLRSGECTVQISMTDRASNIC
jgi:amino acid permease